MTMIISAHLGDCILIAADKRAMFCDTATGTMQRAHDDEPKIKLWCRGAFAGTGETVFINRVAHYFTSLDQHEQQLRQMDIIHNEIEKRISEGVPENFLLNNHIVFSIYEGNKTFLYSIPIKPFLQYFEKNRVQMISPLMKEIKPWVIDLSCFIVPADMRCLQDFQRALKPLKSFATEQEFLDFYIQNLKQIFAIQAAIDPSITTSFDLYIQSCHTGQSIALHVPNHILPPTHRQ
ncbi:hypothetical protein [Acinetobacter larvae]|uniref:Uncharacterized protein n=1 Tax=Acinetobacter larvae TaxID=1789224 RepID=A0A1B2LWD7_9GAMM|nr:hypothetical protein [Acinetobacter larvae]AOA57247.1 hypothetical protein BFG52_02005 [Acinetobacter larvae]